MMRSTSGAGPSSASASAAGGSTGSAPRAGRTVKPAAPAAAEHDHQQHKQQHQGTQEQERTLPAALHGGSCSGAGGGGGPMSLAADAAYMSIPSMCGEVEVESQLQGRQQGGGRSVVGRREGLEEAVGWMMERSER
ncbi:hypothetical protein HYH02_003441 [Chlamydomonas schloesseri]|uniref:Uncharacterized protein n=1 Tax=Chlamydomonas schloesseri TaxID=2026947 RepID=A0A835WQB0_9CHLO|nr:hypothetical protein HYH02_003441 [Chlamydomonas schloesseri]|eukprot:KAG2451661.1 hypothetical protein HYH02_003441 [Chlamydomonas schloesseri]